jgi:AcrR family transcriptional regulator
MPRIHGRSTAGHIADVAGRLFYSEGLESLGVDRVSDLAGVTKKTLYRHFGSKDALVAAAVRGESPLAIPDRPADPAQGISDMFRQVVDFVSRPEFRGCPVLNAASRLSDFRHPARQAIREQRLRRRAWFRDRAVELGAKNPDGFADQLIVAFDGGLASSMIFRSPAPAQAAVNIALMIVQTIAAEHPRQPS